VIAPIRPLFALGHLVATHIALQAFAESGDNPAHFIARHQCGDWGDLDEHDKRENNLSVKRGFRILSSYRLKNNTKVWIITEADRSSTTILLPEEY